jgi:hypothetical protein
MYPLPFLIACPARTQAAALLTATKVYAMDYKELLKKYLARVMDCEGVAFIDEGVDYTTHKIFNEEELSALRSLAHEAREEYKL